MKIVPIFAKKLYSFCYNEEYESELERLLDCWTDITYLFNFLEENKSDLGSRTISEMTIDILEDVDYIEDRLIQLCSDDNENLDFFFKSLYNQEYQFIPLSKQKGRKDYLRLYAIRIDCNCYVITGGAIKLTRIMEERSHTLLELQKLENARLYFKMHGVFDSDSFNEFIY